MSEETARIVVISVGLAGGLVWLVSVVLAWRMLRGGSDGDEASVLGVAVDGSPERISERIASFIADRGSAGIIPIRIDSADEKSVRFRTASGASLIPFTRDMHGEFQLGLSTRGRTSVRLVVDQGARRRAARVALAVCLLAGLPVLVGLTAALLEWVVPSQIPGVRGQCFQSMQAVHALWPPFLILHLGRRGQRMVEESLRLVVDRLRYGGKDAPRGE